MLIQNLNAKFKTETLCAPSSTNYGKPNRIKCIYKVFIKIILIAFRQN